MIIVASGEQFDDTEVAELDHQFDAAQQARRESGIEHKEMRARLRSKLFGASAEPVKLGRFVILERLGQGGMGVVYAAYDPELDRRVALKLIRTGLGMGGTQAVERLHREAQALARLSHPNVVPVYDVGVLDEQVFIVMEFVVGSTLRQWAQAEERSWREILDVYKQAGQGLAAAHEVGLVHRDFKPDNVLLGEDGRARVLDFGLARACFEDEEAAADDEASEHDDGVTPEADDEADVEANVEANVEAMVATQPRARKRDPRTSVRRRLTTSSGTHDIPAKRLLEQPLTVTGAVLGTPAFMSPEQFGRSPEVDDKSDQFSFCLALYEGLYGQRAFAGETLAELKNNVCTGEPRPAPGQSKVPRWIMPILRRGLERDPSDRYPSMDELLDALHRDPARTRQRWLVAALVLALVATAGYAVFGPGDENTPDVCGGAERELAGVWNDARRATVEAALMDTAMPYAAPAWERVSAGLDDYADAWASMHESACRAHQRGEQSGLLLDKRMACLAQRRVALDSVLDVLGETDADSLGKTVDVVHGLPSVAYCGNIDALMADVPPPEDPLVARKVSDLRVQLSRAEALESAGRYTAADQLLAELAAAAEPLGYRPLLAEIRLLEGRVDLANSEQDEAIEPLRQAVSLGLATGMERVGLEALARYIYARGVLGDAPEGALSMLFVAESLTERVPDSTFAHALLLNNAGVVRLAQKRREEARVLFERALELRERANEASMELTSIRANLAIVTEDGERRAALMARVAEERERVLGAEHPHVLDSRLVQSFNTLNPKTARELFSTTCAGYQRFHPSNLSQLGLCYSYLGFLDYELDDRAAASEHFALAAEAYATAPDPWYKDRARGYSLLAAGAYERALVPLDAARQALERATLPWWEKKHLADVYLATGICALALDRPEDALRSLEAAHRVFMEILEINESVDTRQRWARTVLVLASALWPPDGKPDAATRARARDLATRARARDLIDRAETWYREAGDGYQGHLAEIADWRQARGIAGAD